MDKTRSFKGAFGVILFVGLCLVLFQGTAQMSQAADTFKIGVPAPMTGPCAETGKGMKGATEIAVEEINAAGGILGKKIEVFYGDDESKAAAGASVVERMINKDKVDIIIGTMNSNVGLATMEIAANYRVPFILTCPASQKITDKIAANQERYKYLVKSDPTTTAHAVGVAAAADFLAKEDPENTKNKTAFLLMEHNEWGKSIGVAAVDELKKVGWKVIDQQVHDMGETNFMAMISKIKAKDPDILVTAETSASAAASLARQFLEQGLQMYIIQVYGPLKPGYLEALGNQGDGIITEIMVDCHTKDCDKFTKKFVAKYGAPEFDVCGNMQYDMLHMTKAAYEKAGSFDKDKFIKAFLAMSQPGTIGVYEYDQKTHESKVGKDYIPTIVRQLQNGKWEFLLPDYMRKTTLKKPSWFK